jgi:hypothetical protein
MHTTRSDPSRPAPSRTPLRRSAWVLPAVLIGNTAGQNSGGWLRLGRHGRLVHRAWQRRDAGDGYSITGSNGYSSPEPGARARARARSLGDDADGSGAGVARQSPSPVNGLRTLL